MSTPQHEYEIIRLHGVPDEMCYIQNVHTCQCSGSIEPAFTSQDVRSCMCPTIIRMHGLRQKCDPCRRQEKKQGKKKKSRRTESINTSGQTVLEGASQEAGGISKEYYSTPMLAETHARQSGEEGTKRLTPRSSAPDVFREKTDVGLKSSEVFTSTSWNIGRPQGTLRVGRLMLSGDVDIIDVHHTCNEQEGTLTKQQIVDQIEMLLGQLAGVNLAGLVVQTLIV